ncbi:sulfate adenylyltransferase [Sulfurovum sp. bin170]|uniref:sulfate adenylyltransferase n=1 Tax=Sulfurovum sp. bin170 TaxID=2695268 RepID=UPI0013DEAA0E|nr:sulfate adenylyltransferase [Sulfurovum sp. bin170]NEW60988.1 sulfate adenylyltransferase [Sulfurovum sp. bin170]
MASSRKNRQLYIDAEAHSTLALVQEGLISPVDGLMSEDEAIEVDKSKMYKGVPYPFAFILAPSGKRNEEVLKTAKRGEVLELVSGGVAIGELTVESTYDIDKEQRVICIYGTADPSHPNVKDTMSRLGNIAVNGKYTVEYPLISTNLKKVQKLIEHQNAKEISGFMITANPLNRAQERMIRQALDKSDMLILFLLKPFKSGGLRFDIRYEAIMSFIENFLPANRVVVVPLENTYIFSGYNELVLDALVAKNFGCTRLIVGKNHAGLGLYYDENRLNSIFDASEAIKLDVSTVDQYVYCNLCRTLVSSSICPHGQHHHIHYHSPSIMKLIKAGIMPPSVLVRREVSASILSTLFPDRFENLQELYDSLIPNDGIMEEHSEEDFYIKLMGMYQTTSLT